MKIVIRLVIFGLIVGLLAFVKIKYFPTPNLDIAPAAAGAKTSGAPMSVAGIVMKGEKLDNKIFAVGSIIPTESVDLRPEASGKIIQLNIEEGKAVKKGQLLVKLNDADLQAQIRKTQASLILAEQSEQRLRKLLDVKGISQDEYDIVANQISGLKADIEFTQAQVAKTEVYAPFNGVCGLRSVSLGSYATPQTPIATVQQLNPVKLDFTVPEKYANQVRIGDEVRFYTEGGKTPTPGTPVFKGKVYAAESQIDPITRTLKLRATAPNPDNLLHPGAFIKVDFNLKEMDAALMIPTEALIPILKGQQVYLCKNGKATLQTVDVGVRTDTKVQITGGVSAGDTLITEGFMSLRPNANVKVNIKY